MLSDEVREKIVLALTGTTREQCQRQVAKGQARCAMGMLAGDVYGCYIAGEIGILCDERYFKLQEELPTALRLEIVQANDAGATFDEIAKLVKEWEG